MFWKKKKIEQQIEKLNKNVYELLNAQRERIFALREENGKLFEELKAMQGKEQAIANALILVNSTKRETEEMLVLKKNAEIERLKAFSENWQKYFERVFALLPQNENMAKIDAFNKKLRQILTNEQSPASATYMLEKMRLHQIEGQKNPLKIETASVCVDQNEIIEIKENLKNIDGYGESSATVSELPDLTELLKDLT